MILVVATSLPSSKLPQIGLSDKLEHFIAYFVLAVLVFLVLLTQEKKSIFSTKPYLFTMIVIVLYAILDELHQSLIPGRYCEVIDLAADVIGGLLGVLFTYIVLKSISFITAKSTSM
ncbi:MAG: VanZ family protein [Ignavibacteria bacterium]|nr:VanZ family protein [Ignavibacteria bacterium]